MFLRHLVKIERRKNYNFEVRIEKESRVTVIWLDCTYSYFIPILIIFREMCFHLNLTFFCLSYGLFVCVVLIVVRFIVCFFKYNKFCKKEREQ